MTFRKRFESISARIVITKLGQLEDSNVPMDSFIWLSYSLQFICLTLVLTVYLVFRDGSSSVDQ